jgi:hypothetical protein
LSQRTGRGFASVQTHSGMKWSEERIQGMFMIMIILPLSLLVIDLTRWMGLLAGNICTRRIILISMDRTGVHE